MTPFALILATAPQCAPLPEVVATLADQYGEHEISRAAEDRGGVVMTFASAQGSWTLIVVPPADGPLIGCMVASGTQYVAVPVGELN